MAGEAKIFWVTVTGLSEEPSREATLAALRARAGRGYTVLDLDYRPGAAALKLFALWCLSFLPGWLYVRFLGMRAKALWNEYRPQPAPPRLG